MAQAKATSQNSGGNALLALVLVLVGLYLARVVFIPFALALLLAFLLGPPVVKLRRLGVPRVPAVLMVVSLSFLLIGAAGVFMTLQFGAVARQLPEYQAERQAEAGKHQGFRWWCYYARRTGAEHAES